MKVYLDAPKHLSRAMHRVTKALAKYGQHEVVTSQDQADFVLLHVIGYPETVEAVKALQPGQTYGIVQYCMRSTQRSNTQDWLSLWRNAAIVWSYYDLRELMFQDHVATTAPFYYAPLGVDDVFAKAFRPTDRHIDCVTTGYVSTPSAEAIEEVALAAAQLKMNVVHVGPSNVEGMATPPEGWVAYLDVSDEQLGYLYRRSRYVSGLRHGEGFELPALEGLCCGARPIVFNRSEMKKWYGDHVIFVQETSGPELVQRLVEVLKQPPRPVSLEERQRLLAAFSWERIAGGFWQFVADRRVVSV